MELKKKMRWAECHIYSSSEIFTESKIYFSAEPSTSNPVLDDEQTETMDSDTIDEMSAEMKAFMLQTIQHRQQSELKFVAIYFSFWTWNRDEEARFFCFIFLEGWLCSLFHKIEYLEVSELLFFRGRGRAIEKEARQEDDYISADKSEIFKRSFEIVIPLSVGVHGIQKKTTEAPNERDKEIQKKWDAFWELIQMRNFREEAKKLYGLNSEKILAMEKVLDMGFQVGFHDF